MLKGLPASGKSSWAKGTVSTGDGLYKRVNKDDLRQMLDAGIWSSENEDFVLKVRDYIVIEALRGNKEILIDDTNLDPKHEARLREIAEQVRADFEIREFDADVDECIRRDRKRTTQVGEKVIFNMHKKYVEPEGEKVISDPSLPPAILCDIDGTLAIKGARSPFEWARVGEDTVNRAVEDLLFTYERQADVILLSGRDSVCRKETEEWLVENDITYEKLYMRPEGDKRPDWVVKRELFDAHVRGKYRVIFVLDDRNQVVRLWRNMGLPCFQVNDGYF